MLAILASCSPKFASCPIYPDVLCGAPTGSSEPVKVSRVPLGAKPITARVTYYTPFEDKWGWLNACPDTGRSKEGVTVAACHSQSFGTKVYIPGLEGQLEQVGYKVGDGDGAFVIQDRGSAVSKRTASKGKYPIIDVFVKSNTRRNQLMRKMPDYMTIYILPTQS